MDEIRALGNDEVDRPAVFGEEVPLATRASIR